MQPSRRAFLLGRRPARTGWDALRLRLARLADGPLDDLAPGRARLAAHGPADVRHARALCAEYGAVLALAGGPAAAPGVGADGGEDAGVPAGGAAGAGGGQTRAAVASRPPVLEVDPARLDFLVREGAGWRAGPGCRAQDLAQAGLARFAAAPPGQTLAQWLAGQGGWPPGGTAASGLAELDLLLADGTVETLGPFGQADVRPLRSAATQRLVPALFQLADSPDAAACLAAPAWPARYRLDALRPRAPHGVNLAHLLLGHGGTLAWVEGALLLDEAAAGDARQANAPVDGRGGPADEEGSGAGPAAGTARAGREAGEAARRLDARVRACFDPRHVYGAAADGGARRRE